MASHPMPPGNPLIRLLLLVIFIRPRVELTDEALRVSMGWGFGTTIPRRDIVGAERAADVRVTLGAHGWGGRYLVNTTTTDLVRITVDPPARGRQLGIPVRVRELRVSVADTHAFLAELGVGRPA